MAAASGKGEDVREQDRFLPIGAHAPAVQRLALTCARTIGTANISRIMKRSLPPNAKVSREAKETVQECVSEFISFVTSEASDKVLSEKRKTVTGDDVLAAMSSLGFEKYVEPLVRALSRMQRARARVLADGSWSEHLLAEICAFAASVEASTGLTRAPTTRRGNRSRATRRVVARAARRPRPWTWTRTTSTSPRTTTSDDACACVRACVHVCSCARTRHVPAGGTCACSLQNLLLYTCALSHPLKNTKKKEWLLWKAFVCPQGYMARCCSQRGVYERSPRMRRAS